MKTVDRVDKSLLSVARHEAAHCVIGELLNIKVSKVTLKPKETGELGLCEFDGRSMRFASPFSWAMTAIAGSIADNLYNVSEPGVVSADDYHALVELGVQTQDLAHLHYATERMVRAYQDTIELVADSLVANTTLKAKQLAVLLADVRKFAKESRVVK